MQQHKKEAVILISRVFSVFENAWVNVSWLKRCTPMKHPTESVSQVTAHLFQAKRCRLSFWILLQCPLGNQGKICSEVLPNLIAKVEIKVFSSFSVFASEKLIAFQWQCTKIWSTEVIQLETTCCCSCLFSLPPLSSCHSEKDFHWKEMLARLSRLLFNWLHSPETKIQKFLKLKWQWCKKVFPPSPSL